MSKADACEPVSNRSLRKQQWHGNWPLILALVVAATPFVFATALHAQPVGNPADAHRAELDQMVDEEVVATGIKNPRVIEAMRATPRHEFVPAPQRRFAFFDMALPIGHGQSISPPFVVAYMTDQLDPQPTDKVLEIGTGSGYQAAVLSPLVKDVYTIEIVEPLGKRAAAAHERLGYENVHGKIGDGYQGWPEHAPFDKIIVTCSPENVPRPLVDQLREGGRLIVPIGERFQQTLYLFKKIDGKLVAQALEPTMFVPMTGAAEKKRVVFPDGTKPTLLGGSFEKLASDKIAPEGWYYLRRARVEDDPKAPDGKQVIRFANDVPGRGSRALQAFAIDGRTVKSIDVSCWIEGKNLHQGRVEAESPRLFVGYFGEDRLPCGEQRMGPWSGTFAWRKQQAKLPVPPKARMAILWIGLLGGTGEIAFDDVRVTPHTGGSPSVAPKAVK